MEFLPDDEEIEERRRQGRGLTRPELALLLAYGKIALNHALTEAGSAGDPYLARELRALFSAALRRRFAERIERHRLRTQIIITATTNSIVNRVGPALLMQCVEQTATPTPWRVARAYTIARDSADLRALWSEIEASRRTHASRRSIRGAADDRRLPAPSDALAAGASAQQYADVGARGRRDCSRRCASSPS